MVTSGTEVEGRHGSQRGQGPGHTDDSLGIPVPLGLSSSQCLRVTCHPPKGPTQWNLSLHAPATCCVILARTTALSGPPVLHSLGDTGGSFHLKSLHQSLVQTEDLDRQLNG